MQIHKTHHQINLSAVESASQNMFLVPMKNCGQSFKLWKVSKTDMFHHDENSLLCRHVNADGLYQLQKCNAR